MIIERVELHQIEQDLVQPFRTSFGEKGTRPCILVAVYSEGVVGWGECVAESDPLYSEETLVTAWHMLTDFIIPSFIGREVAGGRDLPRFYKMVRGNPMARAAVENAVWALEAEMAGRPLSALLGGVRNRVEVGVSIGIQPTLEQLMARVDDYLAQGYRRIKIKIEPGWEVAPVKMIREKYPDLLLMADANSAFTLDDVEMLRQLDTYNLLMIEQPLAYDDIADHARLQAQLQTPICLDESIHSAPDARAAIDLQACRIINMKVGRVGGFSTALKIHDMAQAAGIRLWCGGMLETGVGRAANIHLASLPNFALPGDISATDRYFHEDVAEPPFVLNREDSTMTVPAGTGLGVTVVPERVAKYRQQFWAMNAGD